MGLGQACIRKVNEAQPQSIPFSPSTPWSLRFFCDGINFVEESGHIKPRNCDGRLISTPHNLDGESIARCLHQSLPRETDTDDFSEIFIGPRLPSDDDDRKIVPFFVKTLVKKGFSSQSFSRFEKHKLIKGNRSAGKKSSEMVFPFISISHLRTRQPGAWLIFLLFYLCPFALLHQRWSRHYGYKRIMSMSNIGAV